MIRLGVVGHSGYAGLPAVLRALEDVAPRFGIQLYYEKDLLALSPNVRPLEKPASIDALALAVGQQLPEREFLMPADDIGTQPLRFFVTEFVREAAFALLEDELPYAAAPPGTPPPRPPPRREARPPATRRPPPARTR